MITPVGQPVSLDSLAGTWRRRWIRWPGRKPDASTHVWWVQSARQYGELRIPRGRPSFAGVRSFGQCSKPQLLWLATQEGFAGELSESGGVFHWWRDVDFQPFDGRRDVGRLSYENPGQTVMVEVGAEAPYYTKLWEREAAQPPGTYPPVVTRIDRPGGHGLFVGVGHEFVLAVDRRPKLPAADSLAELVAGANFHDPARWLNAEISFGKRDRDEGRNGTILHSTLPWREGELAFSSA